MTKNPKSISPEHIPPAAIGFLGVVLVFLVAGLSTLGWTLVRPERHDSALAICSNNPDTSNLDICAENHRVMFEPAAQPRSVNPDEAEPR